MVSDLPLGKLSHPKKYRGRPLQEMMSESNKVGKQLTSLPDCLGKSHVTMHEHVTEAIGHLGATRTTVEGSRSQQCLHQPNLHTQSDNDHISHRTCDFVKQFDPSCCPSTVECPPPFTPTCNSTKDLHTTICSRATPSKKSGDDFEQ